MRDPGPRAASGVSCGIQCGAGASYGIRRSTWDPGLSTTSRMPCGIQCGIMVINVGARTSNVIPTSVRDPPREHRCRAVPGDSMREAMRDPGSRTRSRIPSVIQCGISYVTCGPEFHAGCTAGSGPPQVITTTVRDSLRGQGGCGVPGILCRMHKAGSGIPYGIRTYTRDSIRGPGCRTGPGGPSGAPCGVPDLVWATEFHVEFNAGSEPCVVQRCIPH